MSDSDVAQSEVSFRNGDVRLSGTRWDRDGAGSAGLVLFLHGGGQTRHSWGRAAARIAGAGWTAVTVDARGHGDSDWAPDGDYTLDALVGDLDAILGSLPDVPVLVGASTGGITALAALGERADAARGLALVDVAPRIDEAGRERILAFMAGAPRGFASLSEVADAIHAYNPHRPRPRRLDGLRKNVRRRADGRWYWHWDPRFLRLGEEPTRGEQQARLEAAAGRVTADGLHVHRAWASPGSTTRTCPSVAPTPTRRGSRVRSGTGNGSPPH